MTMAAQERRPEHISPDVWRRAGRLSVQQLVGQLAAFGPFMVRRCSKRGTLYFRSNTLLHSGH